MTEHASSLSDGDLLSQLKQVCAQERRASARLVALLMEVDARKLYAQQSCSSLFTYCVQVLHFSEHAAYLRIEAARAARRFPTILDRLSDGTLHLTAISLLAPHLTPVNHGELSTLRSTRASARWNSCLRACDPNLMPRPSCANCQHRGQSLLLNLDSQLTPPKSRNRAVEPRNRRLPLLRSCDCDRPRSSRSRRNVSRCSLQSVVTHTTSFAKRRICCGTRFRMAIPRRFSIAR